MTVFPARRQTHETTDDSTKQQILLLVLWILLGFLVLSVLLLAAVPPVSRDALTHHLFVPRLYLEHGAIYEIPSIAFSYYPMNLDLLYMIPLYFGTDILPKYIHFTFALLTTLLIYNYLKTRTSRIFSLTGSLLFLSIPIIVKLSITAYVDLGLMFFSTASLLLLFRWLHSGYKIQWLLLAGISCGLAAGTKYNGLVSLFLLTLFTPVLYIRSKNGEPGCSRTALFSGLLFALAALAAFSPWLIRNYAWTGNPIYPLHNSLFQQTETKSSDIKKTTVPEHNSSFIKKLTKISTHSGGVFASRKILYHETWWQALLLPIRFFFSGQDDNPRYFDGKLNPFLFILPFFAFIRKSSSPALQLEKHTLLYFAVLFFFFTFFQESLRIRYIVTIVPALVLLSIFGLHNIYTMLMSMGPRWVQKNAFQTIVLIAVIMLAYNGQYIVQQFRLIQPLSYIQGVISREDYIIKFRPEYPAIRYANQHISRSARVLCIFLGNRGYYMHFQPIFIRPGKNGLLKMKKQLPDTQKKPINIQDKMKEKNITYILLRDDLTDSWYKRLAPPEQEAITRFFQHNTVQLYSSGGYTFYAVK